MDFLQKADALAAYLKETDNGFDREDSEEGTLLTLADAEGNGYGIALPREGAVRITAMLGQVEGGLPAGSEPMLLHTLNRLNEQLTFGKLHLREDGFVLIWAPYIEAGPFSPAALVRLLAAVGRQAPAAGKAFAQTMEMITGGMPS